MIITSTTNPKIKEVVLLRDKNSARREFCLFLIEGYREILRATSVDWPIKKLFVCKEFFLGSNEEILIETLAGKNLEIYECSKDVFQKISYRDRPDGLLAVADQIHRTLDENFLRELATVREITKDEIKNVCGNKDNVYSPFFIIAESVEKPGNLGTILRSADAVGVDGVIICDQRTDIFNPNVVRASVGTLFTNKIFEVSSEEALKFLKKNNVKIIAASPHAEKDFWDVDFKNQAVAILVGTEQYGLSDTLMNGADITVKIPMIGMVDSLNVASATTLLLYEVFRQRFYNLFR